MDSLYSVPTPVPISLGGTNNVTKTEAMDALAPGTTKGDIIVFNGTDNVRLAAGANTQVLTVDNTQATGLKWADAAAASLSIGSPVVGGAARRVLFEDGSAQLDDDVSLTFNPALVANSTSVPPQEGGTVHIFNIGYSYSEIATAMTDAGPIYYGALNVMSEIDNTNHIVAEYRGTRTSSMDLRLRRSRPTTLTTLDADLLGAIYGEGYDNQTPKYVHAAAGIIFQQQGDVGTGYVPGKMIFQTSPQNSIGPQTRMTIDRDGALTIHAGPVYLGGASVNGIVNAPESLFFNIDSNDNSTSESFTIKKNTTDDSGGTTLWEVLESGTMIHYGLADIRGKVKLSDPTDVHGFIYSETDLVFNMDSGNTGSPEAIAFRKGSTNFSGGATLMTIREDGSIRPGSDGSGSLGIASVQWGDLYTVNVRTTGKYYISGAAVGAAVDAVTNSVADDGTHATFPDFTDGAVYATDYANLHKCVSQMAREIAQLSAAIRAMGT